MTTFFSQNHNYSTNDYGQTTIVSRLYVFKKAVDWTPQSILKLTTKLLNVVRVQHVGLNDLFMVLENTNSVEDTKDIVFLTNVSSASAYFKSC